MVFTVTQESSGKTADTGEIDVVVPAKSTDGEIQAEVQAEADKITSVTQPTQDATTLTMPTVASGYTIKIKSSTNESVIERWNNSATRYRNKSNISIYSDTHIKW
ncbi:alpha-L-fucosidase domain protein [Clostridioides difficile 655]|nr:alpha-L-fucosidase domain protein [Clostridioides difficile 655]EQH49934.1 alpha-L-fucosidase domain protein [Clostridioides difficile DA00246]